MAQQIVLPDEVVQALIALRDESTRNAFEVGRLTALVIEKAGGGRGVTAQVVAQVASLTARSPSRVYRFLYLWRSFGATGLRERYPVLGLSHWEMAYRLRQYGDDVVRAFLDMVAEQPTMPAAAAAEVILADLRPAPAPDADIPAPPPATAPGAVALPTEEQRLTPEKVQAWLEQRPDRAEVVQVMQSLARETAESLQMLAEAAGLSEEDRQAIAEAMQRVLLLVKVAGL